jgi:hypothetical protein
VRLQLWMLEKRRRRRRSVVCRMCDSGSGSGKERNGEGDGEVGGAVMGPLILRDRCEDARMREGA